ncbi:MAG: cation-translocating P-type ATPase [Nevskia sp.]|nr:cation-translocating P-type ATPase [Nevskia sp.]
MSASRDWTVYDRPELRAGFATTPGGGGSGGGGSDCEVMLALDGMHCAACAGRATQQLAGQATDIHVNVAAKTARFRFDPKTTRLSALLLALDAAGLDPRILAAESSAKRDQQARRIAFARIGVATICAMQVMMLAWPSYLVADIDAGISQLLRGSQLVLSIPGVLWAGWPIFANAGRAIRSRQLDMDVPVALALFAACAASTVRVLLGSGDLYFDTATMFVWFLTVGRYLEGRSRARASERLRLLAGRRALTAQRRINGPNENQIETIAIGALAVGDEAVVAPGETLPADGVLLEHAAELDEALLSGESRPQLRQPGQTVLAGTLNLGSAPLLLKVERLGASTVLAQITQLLDHAQTGKPKLQQLADRIAGHFIAAVLVLAAIAAALALYRGTGGDQAFAIALAVLVASCPCALSLAVPVALAAATSRLARSGVLVANTGALQSLATIDRVLFDKTGTLTDNRMQRVRVLPLAGGDAEALTAIAATLERGSRHPIASAFADVVTPLQAEALKQVAGPGAGAGISGRIAGQDYWLGALDAAPHPVSLPASFASTVGDTVIVLSDDTRPLALLVIGTRLRTEAAAVVAELQRRGLHLELLSGDAKDAVQAVAQALGIGDCRARQTPAAKLARLQALQADGHRVLAVGDGLNDAPLLAAADVSACMPQGAALTQAKADLLLLGDSLSLLPLALDVARATQARIRENLCWALGYNLLVLPLAMSGTLAPWLAAAGMSLSSLLVVGNALRLERLPSPSQLQSQFQPLASPR